MHNDVVLSLLTFQLEDSRFLLQPETTAYLVSLLHQYEDVFQVPRGLSPPREYDHAITLQYGTPPILVRSYRYPCLQKTEIEKIVHEMLEEGVIRSSSSPFSSPVLLAKRKLYMAILYIL